MTQQSVKRFPALIQKAFEAWVSQDTRADGGAQDERSFFDFVKAYCRYSRRSYSSEYLREAICERWEDELEESELKRQSKKYADLFDLLTQYEGIERNREKKKYERELF